RMGEMDGMALHRQLQSRYPALPVIMMTAHGSIPDAVEATKQGNLPLLLSQLIKMSYSIA
ncbi:response regulator, partial [Psychrobacter sp. SIMBA_152]